MGPLRNLRDQLLAQSRLFESPAAYEAGVEDALAAVRDLLEELGFDFSSGDGAEALPAS